MTKQEILNELVKINLRNCKIEDAQILDRVIKYIKHDIVVDSGFLKRKNDVNYFAKKYISDDYMGHNPRCFKSPDGRNVIMINHFILVTNKYINRENLLEGTRLKLEKVTKSTDIINNFYNGNFLKDESYIDKTVLNLQDYYLEMKETISRTKNKNLAYCVGSYKKENQVDSYNYIVNALYLFDICVALCTNTIWINENKNNKLPIVICDDITKIESEDFAVLMPIIPYPFINYKEGHVTLSF